MCSPVIRRLLAGAVLPLSIAAFAAPAAQAESIAYVKDGNVWLSTPDGGRQYQVTTDGGYSYVSQSDLGTIVALHGDRIRTLDRETGAVRHDILTPASSSYPGTPFRGPFDPVISPDGTKIAYTWYYTEVGETPSCNPSTGCNTVYGRQGTGFTRPDRITGFDDYGFQSRSGWVSPSWMDDGSVISSDPIQVGNEQTAFMTPGDEYNKLPGGTQPWFSNTMVRSVRDVERNRQKTGFAAVAGDANELIQIYRPGGDYPNMPTDACFEISQPNGRFQGPSWKPDGTRLAWSEDDGIYTIAIPDLTDGCGTMPERQSVMLIPGGQYPDWGPADVPPARPATGGEGPGGGQPGPGTTPEPGGPTVTPAPAGALKVAGAAKRKVLRRGLVVRVTGAKPGRHVIRLKAGSRTVGTGKLTVAATGAGSVRVRIAKSARKRLKAQRSVKLTVTGAGLRATVTLR